MSAAPTSPIRLDFDQLVRDYLENLNVNLRGFKAAEGHDFLEAWVPSDDPTEGLLDLVQLARDGRIARLHVVIGPETAAQIDWARLEAEHGPIPRQQDGDRTVLDMVLAVPDLEIHPCYVAGLLRALGRVTHEQSIEAMPDCELVSVSDGGIRLTAIVQRKREIIVRAGFEGAATATQRGLLEALCIDIERKPIQECADHSVLSVERSLRDPSVPPPVPGLVTPENADPAFALPQRLVRALLIEYRDRTGNADTANFFDPPVSDRWARLTAEQRSDELRRALASEDTTGQLELVGMEGPKRVVVRFINPMDSGTGQQMLAQLEARLRQTVEPTLHIAAQVKADKNLIRKIDVKK